MDCRLVNTVMELKIFPKKGVDVQLKEHISSENETENKIPR